MSNTVEAMVGVGYYCLLMMWQFWSVLDSVFIFGQMLKIFNNGRATHFRYEGLPWWTLNAPGQTFISEVTTSGPLVVPDQHTRTDTNINKQPKQNKQTSLSTSFSLTMRQPRNNLYSMFWFSPGRPPRRTVSKMPRRHHRRIPTGSFRCGVAAQLWVSLQLLRASPNH